MRNALTCIGVMAIALCAWTTPVAAQRPPTGPAPGALIDVAGHKVHIHCVGPVNTNPTVILEAGGGGYSSEWSRVQSLLSPEIRSCAYDRAGSGWSEPGPAPRTMTQEAFELRLLLDAAGVRGPYVLVGQSIGGLLIRLFVERYGADVVGIVLVDPAHESDMLGSMRYGGWVRLREKARERSIPEPVREGKPASTYNADDDYSAEEFQRLYLARKSNPVPFDARPLVVLAAGIRPAPPGTSDELWAQMRVEKDGLRVDLSRLSSNSRFVLDPTSTHALHLDNPQLVAKAVEDVLRAAGAGTKDHRLAPY